MIFKISVILSLILLIILGVSALSIWVTTKDSYKKADSLKNEYSRWIKSGCKGHCSGIQKIRILFKRAYPGRSTPTDVLQFVTVNNDDIRINLIEEYPMPTLNEFKNYNKYNDDANIRSNYNSLRSRESRLVFNIYDICKYKYDDIHHFEFWINFLICFPEQMINTFSILFKKPSRAKNVFNIIYWIYDIISIGITVYKIYEYM